MRYAVVLRPKAEEDLEAIWAHIAQAAPINADRFLDKLAAAIDGLKNFPNRCGIAPESEAFGFVIRQRIVGRYRILFTVDGRYVRILRVRSAFQAFLSPEDDELIT